jgi:hypothetical protein
MIIYSINIYNPERMSSGTKGIHFEQSRELDEMDIGHESNLYEITIFGRIHTIAVGMHRKVFYGENRTEKKLIKKNSGHAQKQG